MRIVKLWLEGVKINLGWLIFSRIIQIAKMVVEDKEYTTVDLPYGVWLSQLLESKQVVGSGSLGVNHKDEMNDTYLKFMKVVPAGSELIFQVKGQPSAIPVQSSGQVPMAVDVSSLETKLDSFMERVMTRLDAQEQKICDFMSRAIKEAPIPVPDSPLTDQYFQDILSLLNKLYSLLRELDSRSDQTMRDCIRSTQAVQRMASQGDALLKSGKEIREEMATVFEATRALTLKICNFDTALNAQANHIKSCLDRLETLEYRTRPGYVNPHSTSRF